MNATAYQTADPTPTVRDRFTPCTLTTHKPPTVTTFGVHETTNRYQMNATIYHAVHIDDAQAPALTTLGVHETTDTDAPAVSPPEISVVPIQHDQPFYHVHDGPPV